MATRTTITLEDDLDGYPADETVRFGLGAAEYEMDLNAANAGRLRTQLAPFVEHARKAARVSGPGRACVSVTIVVRRCLLTGDDTTHGTPTRPENPQLTGRFAGGGGSSGIRTG